MERLLNDELVKQIKEVFGQMKEPVQMLYFTQVENCEFCDDTQRLLEELAPLSDKLSLQVVDLHNQAGVAEQYHVQKAPTLVVAAKNDGEIKDYGIRYAGIPSGHEFNTLIQDLLLVSSRDSGLKKETREYLQGIKSPLLLQVFVTPT